MRANPALVVAVAVALAATAGGVALAVRSGGYAPRATATGTITIAPGSPVPAGTYAARYCGSYGNVATQRGYAYTVLLPGARTLALTDSLARTPGAQDPARVTLVVDGPDGRYVWLPGLGGSVTVGAELLTADLDARLVGPRGDTVPLRARFACRPRVPPKRRAGAAG
ncbi:hypothetical protein tb265_18480 [Gemmatimonadetes bacterium T265]|nr:hypothetical protein tb265_18480 [Gemmatimonadetes bacterium T265]